VLGREMQALYPMVPLAQKQAVCVGIMSYNGQIHFGLIGDYDAMADLDSLALDLEASIDDLSAAVPERKRSKATNKAAKAKKAKAASGAGKNGAKSKNGSAKAGAKR
jgi:diacylglycerol O-acyltransferase